MKIRNARYLILLLAFLLGAAAVGGCSESPQDKYNDATQKLQKAKQARQQAQRTLEDKQKELAQARKDVQAAQKGLQQAQHDVMQAEQVVNRNVDDEVLFRSIQRKLLNQKTFDNSAISVSVKNRVVTLGGTVPDAQTRKKALQTAHSQPGVQKVVDALQVHNPDHKTGASDAPPVDSGKKQD